MTRARILHELTLDKIAAVTEPCQEPAKAAIMKTARPYTAAQRAEAADRGWAMPDGTHLIADHRDLMASLASCEGGGASEAVKAHISSRAKALGASDQLPAEWAGTDEEENDMGDDFTAKVRAIMKRDSCSRTVALGRAADENPAQLEKYRKSAEPEADAPDQSAAAVAKARRDFHGEARKLAETARIPVHEAMSKLARLQPELHAAAFAPVG
jgi:hypothetical protein